ncbi:MAG TPA: hypothetical protein VMU60_01690 [Syntrophobacteria bacterium]|nr:hypothetical protein [Syntrophobacteria bacterium]
MTDEPKDSSTTGTGTYYAHLEDGELVLEPYCSCGNQLDETYFCDTCKRHSHPADILCEDQATLTIVDRYIRTSSKFHKFRAMLGKRKATGS